jgi:LysR family transcriptional regulator for bpeEF and oprC
MDRLQSMQIFVRVAELGSFARAAEALQLSRARISEAIANLERALETRLVHRTTRLVRLSEEGRLYYERCSAILADIAAAEAALAGVRDVVRGKLRVHLPIAVARAFLLPALPGFLARHPELSLEVRLENRNVDLLEEGLDCAVCYGTPRDQKLVARKLASTTLLTCAAPSYLSSRGAPDAPGDLDQHACIPFLGAGNQASDWVFQRSGESVRYTPHGQLAFNSMEACMEAAAAGLGIIQVLSPLAHRSVLAGLLTPVLSAWTADAPPVYLVYPPQRPPSARLRAFIDFARAAFDDIGSPDTRAPANAAAASVAPRAPASPANRRRTKAKR